VAVHHDEISVRTGARETTTDITSRVRGSVTRSKIRDGLCSVTSLHTTAALFVNENADADVQRDLVSHLAKLVPRDDEFRHAEGNADAHIKTVFTGHDVTISVRDGELVLGQWQGIYLAEFDGPRERPMRSERSEQRSREAAIGQSSSGSGTRRFSSSSTTDASKMRSPVSIRVRASVSAAVRARHTRTAT
jgi:secondary thiamine-phosphate synthase enzyme